MIYTVTFNPSLDYIVSVPDFSPGKTNRTDGEWLLPGGKGLNVSMVLKNLGFESIALGFCAGFVGDEIIRRMEGSGVKTEFIGLKEGISRINVKLKNLEGTEINAGGPEISGEAYQSLCRRLDEMKAGDILVLAGSIPASLPDSAYSDICRQLESRNIRIVVDATKDLLMNVLPYRPFLIKPNNHELGELFGVSIHTREEAVPYARRLQEKGAQNVLVSMAGEGAVLAAADGSVCESAPPKGVLVNGVGAGDSMVAGFLAGVLETEAGQKTSNTYSHAFYMGLCAGSASAFSDHLATRKEVEELSRRVKQDSAF